jgi:fimbrial isopeptide formation D2 family protein/LPXTG-motif cell wall-anchored protein
MTNKKFKRAAALMVATGMVASCMATSSVSVFASQDSDYEVAGEEAELSADSVFAGDSQLTVSTQKLNRSYELYQIFKGDYTDVGDGTEMLTKIQWGDSVSQYSDEIITALKAADKRYESVESADDVARVLKTFSTTDTADLDDFASIVASVMATKTEAEAPRIKKDNYTNATGANNETLNYAFSNIADGYYLVKEVPNANNKDTDVTYSKYMVNVVGGDEVTQIETKESGGPTITKGIVQGDTLVNKANEGVGDTVTFQLDSVVPDMNGYDKYFYIVNDTIAEGLTFDPDSVKIVMGTGDDAVTLTEVDENTVYDDNDISFEDDQGQTYHIHTEDTDNDGHVDSFKLVFSNFIQYATDTKITITYDALVNKNVVSGNTLENFNTVDLTYSNDPNYDYSGVNEPGEDEDGNVDPTGRSPESTVYIYTAGIELIKVDDRNNRLTGAEFEVKKIKAKTDENGSVVKKDGKIVYEEDTMNAVIVATQVHTAIGYASDYATPTEDGVTAYYKLRRGAYTTTAPTSESAGSYVAAECVKYSKVDGKYVKNVTSGEYYKLKGAADDSDASYVAIKPVGGEETKADTALYETDYVAYERTETPVLKDKATGDTFTNYVSENGTLILDGLSNGIYEITETKAPDGYNLLTDPIKVYVNFNLTNTNEAYWSYWDDSANSTNSEANQSKPTGGVYEIKVKNTKGAKLPSTGGIGTTIFYVAGSVLAISAGVLLVTKKRMKKASK